MAGTGKLHLRDADQALIRVEDLVVEFPVGHGEKVHAVSGISFDVLEGETLGLVGESGCGKSTTGRAIMQLPKPTSGSVVFDGVELTALKDRELREVRREIQMIFQDPISSLNPRRKVGDIVAEGLNIWSVDAKQATAKVEEILLAVGMDPEQVSERRPRQFSGGQCQRICVARALAIEPKALICDEPVSALDVSVQAQIINLLEAMKARYGLTMVFIAHDLAVVKNISDRIIVMYLGKICEVAPSTSLYGSPAHPYTKLLIESIPAPKPTPELRATSVRVDGELPSPLAPPSGCRFRTRCPRAAERCSAEEPQLQPYGDGHFVACHFPNEKTAVTEAARSGSS